MAYLGEERIVVLQAEEFLLLLLRVWMSEQAEVVEALLGHGDVQDGGGLGRKLHDLGGQLILHLHGLGRGELLLRDLDDGLLLRLLRRRLLLLLLLLLLLRQRRMGVLDLRNVGAALLESFLAALPRGGRGCGGGGTLSGSSGGDGLLWRGGLEGGKDPLGAPLIP